MEISELSWRSEKRASQGVVFECSATSGSIGHQKGRQHETNPNWWVDPCNDSTLWSCYGPYIEMEPGLYEFSWLVEFELGSIMMTEDRNQPVAVMDACINTGGTVLIERAMSYNTATSLPNPYHGYISLPEYKLSEKVSDIEIRFRARHLAKKCILKELSIYRLP